MKKILLLSTFAIFAFGALPMPPQYTLVQKAYATTPAEELQIVQALEQKISKLTDTAEKTRATKILNKIKAFTSPQQREKYFTELNKVLSIADAAKRKAALKKFGKTNQADDSDSSSSDTSSTDTEADKQKISAQLKKIYFNDTNCIEPANFDNLSGIKAINADKDLSVEEHTEQSEAFMKAYAKEKCKDTMSTTGTGTGTGTTSSLTEAEKESIRQQERKKTCEQTGGTYNQSSQACQPASTTTTCQQNANGSTSCTTTQGGQSSGQSSGSGGQQSSGQSSSGKSSGGQSSSGQSGSSGSGGSTSGQSGPNPSTPTAPKTEDKKAGEKDKAGPKCIGAPTAGSPADIAKQCSEAELAHYEKAVKPECTKAKELDKKVDQRTKDCLTVSQDAAFALINAINNEPDVAKLKKHCERLKTLYKVDPPSACTNKLNPKTILEKLDEYVPPKETKTPPPEMNI